MKMSGTIGKNLSLSSPLKVEEEAKQFTEKKQGIVSILGSDGGQMTKAASLRRTLSADMSSKKWLAQHEFSCSPMKKIASSEELSTVADSFSPSEGEDDSEGKNELERPGQDDVWRSIQSQKKKLEKLRKFDTWGSILSSDHKAKEEDLSKLPPPYVHPLVKRSTSSLSEKSLEICTESLGSETGSDGYSSYAPSETGDVAEDHDNREEVQQSQQEKESQVFFDRDEFQFVKYNYSTSKKLLSPKSSSFPPPLPSITPCDGEISLQVQSHRKNGRLVLEAVSLPLQNSFRAQRQDGRLLFTFADNPPEESLHAKMIYQEEEELVDEIHEEDVFKDFEGGGGGGGGKDYDSEAYEEETEEEEEEVVMEKIEKEGGAKETGFVMEQAPKLSSGVINVHRSAITMKKLLGLDNRNPTWTHKFKKAVNLEVEEEEEDATTQQLPQSLPRMGRLIASPPAPAAATSFNAYEYFWRTKPTVATLINPINQQNNTTTTTTNKLILSNNSPKGYEQEEMVLLRGNKADYLVPLSRGCKEARRSLFFWEPYCIATS